MKHREAGEKADAERRCGLPFLPKERTVPITGKNWVNIYGAIDLAAAYCRCIDWPHFGSFWQHGCFPPWMDSGPHAFPCVHVYCWTPRTWTAFVARKAEEALLLESGYRRAKAIGLPFAYVPEPRIQRREKSLLVMPLHSLTGVPSTDEAAMQDYADDIAAVRSDFDQIVVCLHRGCIDNRQWIPQFERHGIPWVLGADPADANALRRMSALFHHFEFVTTNGWGSHIPYALSCGAKLSIYGARRVVSRSSLEADPSCGKYEAYIDYLCSESYQRDEEEFLRPFSGTPSNGRADRALGDSLIGKDIRPDPSELRRLMGWTTREFLLRSGRRVGLTLRAVGTRWLGLGDEPSSR